jgi:hypothetical protein
MLDDIGRGLVSKGAQTPAQTDPMLKNANYRVVITQDHDLNGANQPVFVYGMVPESFQINVDSQWSTPFGSGLANLAGNNISNILALSGNRLVGQVMTMQVWQGSSDALTFNVSFELRAWSDAYADVVAPLQALMRMALPSVTKSGFLQSPGPVIDKAGITQISSTLTSVVADVGAAAVQGYASTKNGITSSIASGFNASVEKISDAGVMRKDTVEKNMKNKIHISIGRWFSMDNIVITEVQTDVKSHQPEARTGVPLSTTVTITFKPVFALTAEDISTIMGANLAGNARANGGLAGTINSVIGNLQSTINSGVSRVVDGFSARI